MAPPSFSDIGKQSRDVFGKGYHFGVVKMEVKTKTSTGVELKCDGSSSAGNVSGNLETKYKCPDTGITFTEKWNTSNTLNGTMEVQDKGLPGLKLTLDGSYKPASSEIAGKMKAEYKHDKFLVNTDFNLAASPTVNASASVGYGPWALGYQTAFDSGKSSLVKNNFAMSYATPEMIIHCTGSDKKVFGGGIYHKVCQGLETGVSVNTAVGGATTFAVGCKYDLSKDGSVRAKVDNSSVVGLSFQQKLKPGITLTLSTSIDGTKLNQPGHKVGLALEMAA